MNVKWLIVGCWLCLLATRSFAQSIDMSGTLSYNRVGSQITLGVGRIDNYRASHTTSGTLAIQLWATQNPYTGSSAMLGYKLCEVTLGTLQGGYYFQNVSRTTSFAEPPSGNYNILFVLAEWSNGAFVSHDWANFGQRQTFGSVIFAPYITTQPQSRAVFPGSSVNFFVAAGGFPAPSYQWYRNNILLPGANSSSLTLSSVQASDAGQFKVLVSNSAGSEWSATAILTVNVAPSIVVQPQSRMVTVGGGATISMNANGTAPMSYQWYFNDAPISGATASAYFLASTQPGNAGAYKVRVSNQFGSVESSVAVLTIQNPAADQTSNLLVNGGFELPGSDGFLLPNGSTGVPGWVSVNNVSGGEQDNNYYVRAPYYGQAASEGGHFLYVNNHSHASATLNGIYQDFATLPGNTYQVTFDAATEISYGFPGLLTVSAGDTVTNYTIPNVNAFPLPPSLPYNFSGWYNGSFTFTATGTVTRLQFFDEGVAFGPYLLSQSQIGLAADGQYFYTIAQNDPRIRKFDRTGKYIGDVGSLRDSAGSNTSQTGLATDGEYFYTVATGDPRIRRFDLSGNFLGDVVGFNYAGVSDTHNTGLAVLQVTGAQTRLFGINQGDATVREWNVSNGAFRSNAVILSDISGPISINSDIEFDGQYFYAIAPVGPIIWKFDSAGRLLDHIPLSA